MTCLAPVAPPVPIPSRDPAPAPAILVVAEALQPDLAQGFQIDALRLRLEMERAFGGCDADGAWDWKLAYEAGEVALILFLRKFGRALLARSGSPAALLPILTKVAGLLPTHTRRSEEMEQFQQFSTPLPMGLVAMAAAQIKPRDLVLEPSAGTGLLAILAEIAGGSLALNELADTRADLLRHLFPGCPVTSFDAAQIDDHLDAGLRPSVILMNPPFSAVANVDGRTTEATARHLRSALARLAPGGRLVAITGVSFAPDAPAWSETFSRLTPHDDILVVGEGIETMLSLIEAMPGLPVWAALSSGHLGALLLPEGLQRLYIAIDRDPAGRGAAERLSARATEAGISVRVLEPRLGDFNDDLRAHGPEALRQHLAEQIGPEHRQRLER
jgi:hypothetical protein